MFTACQRRFSTRTWLLSNECKSFSPPVLPPFRCKVARNYHQGFSLSTRGAGGTPCRRLLHKVAGELFFIVGSGAGGVAKTLLFCRQEFFEPVLVDRLHKSFVSTDRSIFQQRSNCIVHKLHSLPFAGNDHVLKFLRRPF